MQQNATETPEQDPEYELGLFGSGVLGTNTTDYDKFASSAPFHSLKVKPDERNTTHKLIAVIAGRLQAVKGLEIADINESLRTIRNAPAPNISVFGYDRTGDNDAIILGRDIGTFSLLLDQHLNGNVYEPTYGFFSEFVDHLVRLKILPRNIAERLLVELVGIVYDFLQSEIRIEREAMTTAGKVNFTAIDSREEKLTKAMHAVKDAHLLQRYPEQPKKTGITIAKGDVRQYLERIIGSTETVFPSIDTLREQLAQARAENARLQGELETAAGDRDKVQIEVNKKDLEIDGLTTRAEVAEAQLAIADEALSQVTAVAADTPKFLKPDNRVARITTIVSVARIEKAKLLNSEPQT